MEGQEEAAVEAVEEGEPDDELEDDDGMEEEGRIESASYGDAVSPSGWKLSPPPVPLLLSTRHSAGF